MVKYCVCDGCTNSSLTGHRVHCFPNGDKDNFRAWVRFVQEKREDFNAASVTKNTVVCGAHFTQEDYIPGDVLESRMGYRSPDRVRLLDGAVPSIHAADLLDSAADSGAAADGSDIHGSDSDDTCTLLANTVTVVKMEDCEDLEERLSVTPESAVKTPEKMLHHSEPHGYRKWKSENGKSRKRQKSRNERKRTNQSRNKENRETEEDEDEEFSTSLSVGDGRYLVDLGSPSEFVVDEECLLQLLKTCRECHKQCTVRKRVTGLKLVVSRACCFCQSHSKWTNLPDDDDGDLQINGKDAAR